jgi:GntR family transcriptional regulator, transcriptional repressor for pyruvate dehydrogenase complex
LAVNAQTDNQALGLMLHKRETVSTELARQLIDRVLLSGKYEVGDRLPPERLLASELGVGRSAVREALKSLSLLGLIDVRQGSGSYIRATESEILPRVLDWGILLGSKRLQDLYEAELYLEPAVARVAARRRQKADLAKLRSALQKVDRRPANAKVGDVVNFHIVLAAITRNEVLMSLVSNMQALMEAWTTRVVEAAGGKYPGQEEHREVYEAIARGDPDAAERAMIEHLTNGAARLSEILGFDWRLEY